MRYLDVVFWIALGLFLFLTGLFNLTNFQIEWGKPIMYFSALIAGILALVMAITHLRVTPQ